MCRGKARRPRIAFVQLVRTGSIRRRITPLSAPIPMDASATIAHSSTRVLVARTSPRANSDLSLQKKKQWWNKQRLVLVALATVCFSMPDIQRDARDYAAQGRTSLTDLEATELNQTVNQGRVYQAKGSATAKLTSGGRISVNGTQMDPLWPTILPIPLASHVSAQKVITSTVEFALIRTIVPTTPATKTVTREQSASTPRHQRPVSRANAHRDTATLAEYAKTSTVATPMMASTCVRFRVTRALSALTSPRQA